MSEMKLRLAEHGGPDEALIVAMTEAMREATALMVTDDADPRRSLALLMTAANMFAGSLFGTLMFMGEVTQQDSKRGADMASRNFREGIKVGLKRATRVAEREGYMGVRQ